MNEQEFCNQFGVPLPKQSKQDRLRALMATRNEWKLYRRTCDKTGEQIISAYHEKSPFTVYKNSEWWGGNWDARDYGRDFDFNRPFFEQFAELQKVVPREGTSVFSSENCDYNSHIRESKNCYLNSLVYRCEDTHYSYWVVNDKDVVDSLYTNDSTLCYWCADLNKGYNCVAVFESNNCNHCYFSYQLRGCDHCLFCSNLANKSYYIFNQKVSKEEFEEKKAQLLNGSWKNWQFAYQKFLEMMKNANHRANHNLNCENVAGDHLYNCRNCFDCFESFESEDCFNGASLSNAKDVHNAYSAGWPDCELIYMCAVTRGSKNCRFCTYTWFSSDMSYSDSCNACDNCFGCIGLHHKKYCILNKEYSKEEYEALLPKIIEHMKKTGEWGQFFPPELSPFAYNETAAMNFFPLTREEAQKNGWEWKEKDQREYRPASITNIPDKLSDLRKELLACESCSKNYKITPQEYAFYEKMHIPIPRECPDCRHQSRMNLRRPFNLWKRECSNCKKKIETSYSPETPEKILCTTCYNDVLQ